MDQTVCCCEYRTDEHRANGITADLCKPVQLYSHIGETLPALVGGAQNPDTALCSSLAPQFQQFSR